MLGTPTVIRFENLRQRTSVGGDLSVVEAKAKPFVNKNAHGILRKVNDLSEVGDIGTAAGKNTLVLLSA